MFNPDTKFPQPITTDNSGNFESAENEEENRKELEIRNKLIEEGKKYGNDFEFIEPGVILNKSELPEKINNKVFKKDIHPNYLKALESQFEDLKKYISLPIIKDSFAGNHPARREWKEKYLGSFSPEVQECYKNNRFSFTRILQTINLINTLRSLEENYPGSVDAKVLDDLENAAKIIPEEIAGNTRDDNFKYGNLSEEEKIRVTDELALVIEKFIKILGEPKEATKKEKERELEEELV